MKERPILFSGPMVRAILEGRKTQTRRVVKPQPAGAWAAPGKRACPYGVDGDLLWVRESLHLGKDDYWHYTASPDAIVNVDTRDPRSAAAISWAYHTDRERVPSIHMPRWASRITLEVTEVRVQRLHDVTDDDADAEGVEPPRIAGKTVDIDGDYWAGAYRDAYRTLWDELNGKRGHSWETNPFVWVIKFARVAQVTA